MSILIGSHTQIKNVFLNITQDCTLNRCPAKNFFGWSQRLVETIVLHAISKSNDAINIGMMFLGGGVGWSIVDWKVAFKRCQKTFHKK